MTPLSFKVFCVFLVVGIEFDNAAIVKVHSRLSSTNLRSDNYSSSTVLNSTSRLSTPPSVAPVNRCEVSLDLGRCLDSRESPPPITRWFFDSQTGECLAFTYFGCGGIANSNNRFGSRAECASACIPRDGATCAMNQPSIDGEWIRPSSIDRTCGNLQCPTGYRCKHGPMRNKASCCSMKTERAYERPHSGRGLCPRETVPLHQGDEILIGASCRTLQCPGGYECRQNRYFSNCCPSSNIADNLAQNETDLEERNVSTTSDVTRNKRSAPLTSPPAWMQSNKFQGDIAGFENQAEFDQFTDEMDNWYARGRAMSEGATSSAVRDPRRLWPNGVVPYLISSDSRELRQAVGQAIQDFQTNTCLRFIERTNEAAYLNIVDNEVGCFSWIGRMNQHQPQKVNLGRGCWSKGIAIHELMHAIGFWHEHQRTDRDQYVQVHQDNIEESCFTSNYQKARINQMNLIGSYDMGSVMHYPFIPFCSKNGQPTMTSKNGAVSAGNTEGMSEEDKRKVSELYGCTSTSTNCPNLEITLNPRDPNQDTEVGPTLCACGIRRSDELATMSGDDKRNTLIVEIGKRWMGHHHLQSLKNTELETMICCSRKRSPRFQCRV